MTHAAMQASLHDIVLPADAAGGAVAGVLATVALAGLLALVAGGLLRLFSLRRAKVPPAPNIYARVAALATLSEAERRTGLLHLLKNERPERFARLRDALYRKDTPLDTDKLTAELLGHD